MGEEFGLSQPFLPEGAEHAVRRAADGVFIDADCGGEEARDEIKRFVVGAAGHTNASGRDMPQPQEVGTQVSHCSFVGHFHQVVEPVAMDRHRFDTQAFEKMFGSRAR